MSPSTWATACSPISAIRRRTRTRPSGRCGRGLALAEARGEARRPPAGEPLAARVGIATGLVVVGDLIGEGAAQEQAVVGETPNLAARLQALAEPGSVVIARRRAGWSAACSSWPISARSASRASPSRCRPGGSRARVAPRAASRRCTASGSRRWSAASTSSALLLERWARAKDGEGQVVLLVGRAGHRQVAPGPGAARALGRRAAHAAALFLLALPHQQRALSGDRAARAGGAARARRPRRRQARQARGAARPRRPNGWTRSLPLLAALLCIPTGERYPPLNLTPQEQKRPDLRGAARAAGGPAARRPVLMVLEDVHWIDPTTLELLDLVIERVRAPAGAARDHLPAGVPPPWTGHAHVTALTLNRLGRRQGAAMVDARRRRQGAARRGPGADPGQDRRRAAVRRGADQDRARIGPARGRGDRYELAGPLPPLAIPSTLQESLMARLDRPRVKEVAQIGAVIGREFPRPLLRDRGPRAATRTLRVSLEGLRRGRARLPARHNGSNAPIAFKHALIRDAAYAKSSKTATARSARANRRRARAQDDRDSCRGASFPRRRGRALRAGGGAVDAGGSTGLCPFGVRRGRSARNGSARAALGASFHPTRGTSPSCGCRCCFGTALINAKGYTAPGAARAYARARELCHGLSEHRQLLPVSGGSLCTHPDDRSAPESSRDC